MESIDKIFSLKTAVMLLIASGIMVDWRDHPKRIMRH
jgi:hypothetical protein